MVEVRVVVLYRRDMNAAEKISRLMGKIPAIIGRSMPIIFRRHSLSVAKKYVGTSIDSGSIQFEILKREGCQPSSQVLEIGCGCLHLATHLCRYLEPKSYVGVDPNRWLRQAALSDPSIKQLMEERKAEFISRSDFDATELGRKFDFIFSHSILSHAAHWQLEQYLHNSSKVLTEQGKIIASIRLAEGNDFGSPGSKDREDSKDVEWVYPGVSWFKEATVREIAGSLGLSVEARPDLTAFYIQKRPEEFHDWLIFQRVR